MKCRPYSRSKPDGAGDGIVFVVEPDDPEDLIPVAADDSEAREETVPSGPTETGWTFYGEGLIPQLKRSLGIE